MLLRLTYSCDEGINMFSFAGSKYSATQGGLTSKVPVTCDPWFPAHGHKLKNKVCKLYEVLNWISSGLPLESNQCE